MMQSWFFKALIITLTFFSFCSLLEAQSEQSSFSEILQIGKGNANSIAWNPNSDTVAIGGSDGIRLYNNKLQEVTYFANQPRNVENLAWSHDGQMIASQGNDTTIQIRDATSGNILSTLVQSAGAYAIAWSPDNRYIAVSNGLGMKHQIVIWNWSSGTALKTFENQDRITTLNWSPDRTRIIAGGWDNHIYIWDINSGKLLANLDNQNSHVITAMWSPDGKKFATTGSGLSVWDARTYKLIFRNSSSEYGGTIAWSADSSQIAENSTSAKIYIFSSDTGEPITTINSEIGTITSLSWNADGSKMAFISSDDRVKVWDFHLNRFSATLDIYSNPGLAISVAWRPNSEQVAIVFDNHASIKIFNSISGSLINELVIPVDAIFVGYNTSIIWSPDGSHLLYTGKDGNALYIWNLLGEQATNPIIIEENQSLYSPKWSPDNKTIATIKVKEDSNEILLWNGDIGVLVNTLSIQQSKLFLWNYDGAYIVFQNDQNKWQMADASRSLVITTPLSSSNSSMAIANPDNDELLAIECDGQLGGCQISKGDFKSGKFIPIFRDEDMDFISDLDISANGHLLAIKGALTIHIWNLQTLTLLARFNFSDTNIQMSWSSDSRRIAIISGGTVRILDLNNVS